MPAQPAIVLGKKELYDKIFACWLGKNIGGTLGAPYECQTYVHHLSFYDPKPKKSAPNDDLDIQLVWLAMMEQKGLPPRLPHFAEYWRKCWSAWPSNEYGFCMRNLARGLMPPVCGWFENYYVDEMGSPIRSEIWACLAPANPQKAAALAWMDSVMDHAGGEGTYGEMFWAAVESAAFVIKDPDELIRIGLSMIPPACNISRVIREVVWCHRNHIRYDEARERVVGIYGHLKSPCNAIQNHGFTIMGWLYGQGFGDKLCKAVNCGFDTDCTGATLGALLGIIGGTRGIPERWSNAVGKNIVLHRLTRLAEAPKNLHELTRRTIMLTEQYLRQFPAVGLGEKTRLGRDWRTVIYRNEEATAAWQTDVRSAVASDKDVDIWFYYNGDPVMAPGDTRVIRVAGRKQGASVKGNIAIIPPKSWQVHKIGEHDFILQANKVNRQNRILVKSEIAGQLYCGKFLFLGLDEAKGYPSLKNVVTCSVCGGNKDYCICNRSK